MLRASAVAERIGIPTVSLVCEGFVPQARATAAGLGMPNLAEAILPGHVDAQTDQARRPADQLPVESVHLKTMIHKIHTGEDLEPLDYTVYGFGNNPTSFNEVLFPGDRRNCEKCHVPDTQQMPLPNGVLPSVAPRDYINPMPPITAACLSCHTSVEAASHALVNTSTLGESCRVCHGPSSEFSVDRSHAR